MALSHRWGVGRICRTLESVLDDYRNAIPMDEVSNVFRDAIEATRRLGIRYLWIDSLCIIQDSPEDWEIESGNMASIYSNASFTIAAALSGDSDTGLFAPRDPLLGKPCRINVRSPEDSTTEVIRIWSETDLRGLNLAYLYPLYTRAWVFQEHTLSPKILHFTPAGILWECLGANYAESEPLRQRQWQDAPIKFPLSSQPDLLDSSGQAIACDKWLDLVETYSGRAMTFDTDWLPAMSGIAKVFSKQLQCDYDEYVGGLWRPDILRGLVWYPNTARARGKNHCRPSTYVGPSWSWASINGPISFPIRSKGWQFSFSLTSRVEWAADPVPAAVVLDVRCVQQGLDPTGRISSGRIVLFGPICENPFYSQQRGPGVQTPSVHTWVRREDPNDTPLEKTKPFELDVPGETLAIDSILLQLYRDFALILERNASSNGNIFYRRIGWCVVGGALNANPSLISPTRFNSREVVVII